MDERFVKKLIAPSFLIVVLSTVFFYEFKYLIDQIFFKKKHFLIIGILSAPENFQQRESVRNTWLKLLTDISGSAYFIIGNEICEVPPLDRPDPHSCISRPFELPDNVTTETEFSTIEIPASDDSHSHPISKPNYVGFGFYVRSKIRVHKLGVLREALEFLVSEVQVKLISASTQNVLASVTFDATFANETTSDVLVKAIKPITIDAYSEALVRLEVSGDDHTLFPDCKWTNWSEGPRVLNFVQLWLSDSVIPHPFTKKSCTYVTMFYSLEDVESVQSIIKNKNRLKEWHQHNKKLSIRLNNESRIFNDILLVDVVDVYRNLSLKLINFYKRILQTDYFHYVLKTDDDSFIDLLRVYNHLKLVSKENDNETNPGIDNIKEFVITTRGPSKFWWWSFFRESWRVQRFGKWRESQYKSVSYPSFPCGGGYVINKAIVDYIVSNEQNLNYFQGEDVSMGIWLSSLSVINYRTPKLIAANQPHELQKRIITKFRGKCLRSKCEENFVPDICLWTCSKDKNFKLPSCNKVEMNVRDMYDTWYDYINNGFL